MSQQRMLQKGKTNGMLRRTQLLSFPRKPRADVAETSQTCWQIYAKEKLFPLIWAKIKR